MPKKHGGSSGAAGAGAGLDASTASGSALAFAAPAASHARFHNLSLLYSAPAAAGCDGSGGTVPPPLAVKDAKEFVTFLHTTLVIPTVEVCWNVRAACSGAPGRARWCACAV